MGSILINVLDFADAQLVFGEVEVRAIAKLFGPKLAIEDIRGIDKIALSADAKTGKFKVKVQ